MRVLLVAENQAAAVRVDRGQVDAVAAQQRQQQVLQLLVQFVQLQEHLEPEQVELSQMLRLPSQQQLQITFSLCV